jgi:hypothetical protein
LILINARVDATRLEIIHAIVARLLLSVRVLESAAIGAAMALVVVAALELLADIAASEDKLLSSNLGNNKCQENGETEFNHIFCVLHVKVLFIIVEFYFILNVVQVQYVFVIILEQS